MLNTSFRARLLILTILLGALPVLASSLFITLRTEQALVWEKQQKLFGITRVLDQNLRSNYEALLQGRLHGGLSRGEKISLLQQDLAKYTDEIAAA